MDWCQVRLHKNWGWFVLCLIEMKTKEYTYYQIKGALLAVMDQKTQWNHQSTLGTPLPGDNIQRNTERIGLARNVHELPVDAFVYENCSINVDTLTEFCTGFEVFCRFF